MDGLVLIHLAIAVIGIVLMITWAKINPVVALIVGALYLGIAAGLGFEGTVTAVNTGFGNLMAEVGLIIGFGIMIGTTLTATGTMQRVVDALLKLFGTKRSPYVLGLTSGIIFPSIYFDVALVILAPIAGAIAKRTGRSIATLAGSLAIGLEVGLLIVVPGVAAVAVAGPLGVDIGTMLLWGIPLGIFFIISSIFVHDALMRRFFNPKTDLDHNFDDSIFGEPSGPADSGSVAAQATHAVTGAGTGASPAPGSSTTLTTPVKQMPLVIAMLPVIVPILLIILDTITGLIGMETPVLSFLGSPVVALLAGLLVGIALAIPAVSRNGIDDLLTKGAQTAGSILLFTGVAGSLGQIITEAGIGEMMATMFQANAAIPVLLTWTVAAVLRIAQGSASVAAITAAALLSPIMGSIDAPPILILLAAGTGAAFGAHVTDNTFWIFKQMLGFTTKGTFKIYTLAQSVFAVIGLGVCLLLDLFI